jgi:hypothetical protein
MIDMIATFTCIHDWFWEPFVFVHGHRQWCSQTVSHPINHTVCFANLDQCAVMHVGLYVKCPLFFLYFNKNLNVFSDFSRTPQYQISWKSVWLLLSCFMCTDRRSSFNRHFAGMDTLKCRWTWPSYCVFLSWFLCKRHTNMLNRTTSSHLFYISCLLWKTFWEM